MDDDVKFYLDQLQPLVGGTITKLVDAGDGFYGFVVKTKGGASKYLILSSDDEGNGPGSFFLSDVDDGA